MTTQESSGQLVRDLPHRIRLAWQALHAAGLCPAKNPRELGGRVWIECRPQPTFARPGDYRRIASRAIRKAGLNIPPEAVTIDEIADRIIVRVPVGEVRKQPEKFTQELLFKSLPGESIVAILPITPVALLNTYDDCAKTLEEVRTVVRKNPQITADDLRKKFARTTLARAATGKQWQQWKIDFASGELTAKNAALVLLETTTGRKRTALKTYLSRARRS
jgi:hypothetical protein